MPRGPSQPTGGLGNGHRISDLRQRRSDHAARNAAIARRGWAVAPHFAIRVRRGDLERLLRQAAALNPHRAQPFLMLAYQFKDAKRLDDAEAAYRSALAAQPDAGSLFACEVAVPGLAPTLFPA